MGRVVFSEAGVQLVMPNEQDPDYANYGGDPTLGQRIPVVYDEDRRIAYIGNPGWQHMEVEKNQGLDPYGFFDLGFFGDPEWGGNELKWFNNEPLDHPYIAEALLEAGYQIDNPESREMDVVDDDADLWQVEDDPLDMGTFA